MSGRLLAKEAFALRGAAREYKADFDTELARAVADVMAFPEIDLASMLGAYCFIAWHAFRAQ